MIDILTDKTDGFVGIDTCNWDLQLKNVIRECKDVRTCILEEYRGYIYSLNVSVAKNQAEWYFEQIKSILRGRDNSVHFLTKADNQNRSPRPRSVCWFDPRGDGTCVPISLIRIYEIKADEHIGYQRYCMSLRGVHPLSSKRRLAKDDDSFTRSKQIGMRISLFWMVINACRSSARQVLADETARGRMILK